MDNNIQNNGSLVQWVMSKCEDWRDHYNVTYRQNHEEFNRLWRGIWSAEDRMRDSERSRLISPALQQAVESSVAEVEEATFGRGKWFDIADDMNDQERQDVAYLRNKLTEDMEYVGARSAIAECILSSAIYGTGIGEIVLEEVTELVPATQPVMDGQLRAIGVEEKTRFVVRLVPVLPQNFLIDPVARNVDEALGVATDKYVPRHVVEENIFNGVYNDVEIDEAAEDSEIAFDPENADQYMDDKVRLTTYYGKVPTYLFEEEAYGLSAAQSSEESGIEEDEEVTRLEGDYTEVIVVIANESTLLKVEANPYMMQDRPIVAFSWDNVPSRFWGRGVCEKGYNSQKALDTELRARIDALALTVHPMMAVDASRLPRGAKLEIRPGKTILTNGNPAEILQPFNFGKVDQVTFAQGQQLMQMVQMATGAIDTAGIPSFAGSEATAAGISMSLGAIIKRHKRTLINFQDKFLVPFISKAAWRYMQFDPENYPVQDYKFKAASSLGIIAREYEVTQLVQLLQTMSPESPLYPSLIESIVDNMNLSNREELIAKLQQANQPNQEQQQLQMQQIQAQMEFQRAQTAAFQGQANDYNARAEKNKIEAQMVPYEAKTDRIKAISTNIRDGNSDDKEFERRVRIAELLLKEKEVDSKNQAKEQAEQGNMANQAAEAALMQRLGVQ